MCQWTLDVLDSRPLAKALFRFGFRVSGFPKPYIRHSCTKVEYPLLRACSSSAALRAAGLHTHVRTHRTSSDPAYLIKSGLLVTLEKKRNQKRNVAISEGSRLKLKTTTPDPVYNPGIRVHTYAQPFLTSNGTWPTSLLHKLCSKRCFVLQVHSRHRQMLQKGNHKLPLR